MTQLYSVTYMYYSLIGCFISILVGWTVSYFTGSESDLYDQELIHPVARKMANFFPGKKRRYAEKTADTKSNIGSSRNGSLNTCSSVTNMEKKCGSSNLAFVQEVPMEQMEVYRTKLWFFNNLMKMDVCFFTVLRTFLCVSLLERHLWSLIFKVLCFSCGIATMMAPKVC